VCVARRSRPGTAVNEQHGLHGGAP
jgi:hypothetical protein